MPKKIHWIAPGAAARDWVYTHCGRGGEPLTKQEPILISQSRQNGILASSNIREVTCLRCRFSI